jgi:hypothetical protein
VAEGLDPGNGLTRHPVKTVGADHDLGAQLDPFDRPDAQVG